MAARPASTLPLKTVQAVKDGKLPLTVAEKFVKVCISKPRQNKILKKGTDAIKEYIKDNDVTDPLQKQKLAHKALINWISKTTASASDYQLAVPNRPAFDAVIDGLNDVLQEVRRWQPS